MVKYSCQGAKYIPMGGITVNRIHIVLTMVILSVLIGCSSGHSPVTPAPDPVQLFPNSVNHSNRTVWGYWTIKLDPDNGSIEIVPDRDASLHFNVVRLLEVQPCTDCLTIKNLSWLPGNMLQCDFQLRHPFPGNVKLTGFDVRGVLVTNADTLFPVSDRWASLDGSNPVLINPDGYTSLFNPVEFPPDTAPYPILGYIPGKFSTGGDMTATLNPFMAYCKGNPRRVYYTSSIESVGITMQYPDGPIEFGYVVDASWIKVDEVTDPVTDFPPEANCLEPYDLKLEVPDQLTDVIGDQTAIHVEVFDHQGSDSTSAVSIECPQLFAGDIDLAYSSQTGDESWRYDGAITNEHCPTAGSYPALIRAQSAETDANLGDLTSYAVMNIEIAHYTPTSGELIWAKRAGGTEVDWGKEVATLSDDSIVVTGYFSGSANFGEGEVNETVLESYGETDIFAARYNSGGNLVWVRQAGGIDGDTGTGITVLSDDSFVVTGSTSGSALFGEGEANETTLETGSNSNVFIACYEYDGSLVWARSAGDESSCYAYSICALSDDSTVVTGFFRQTVIFGKGESNETTLVSAGGEDIFIARYDPDGRLVWANRAGGTTIMDCGVEIVALTDNSVAVTGEIRGTVTFGQGEINETVLVVEGNSDIFVARYNPDGTLSWVRQDGGGECEVGEGITALSDNSIVVAGLIKETAIFGQGEPNETVLTGVYHDMFIASYNPDSSLVWAENAGGSNSDIGWGITALLDDSTVATGFFMGTANFGAGEPCETSLITNGKEDIFIARYNPDGTLAWARSAGGPKEDWGSGITTLSDNSSVVTGFFRYSAIFGKGEVLETELESYGHFDIFIARFAP